MIKRLTNKRGQGIIVQYATTFFLVVAFVSAMSVYVKRAVQARIKQARDYSLREVRRIHADPQYNIQGNLWSEYEPYYVESQTVRDISQRVEQETLPGGLDGIISYDMPEAENQTRFQTRRTQQTAEHAD